MEIGHESEDLYLPDEQAWSAREAQENLKEVFKRATRAPQIIHGFHVHSGSFVCIHYEDLKRLQAELKRLREGNRLIKDLLK